MHGPLHHFPPGYMGLGRTITVHTVSTVFYSSHAGIEQWVLFFLVFLCGFSFFFGGGGGGGGGSFSFFFFFLWIMHLASVEYLEKNKEEK